MEKKLLDFVAPCSMLCYTCMAFHDGAFSECAPRLRIYSEGVCEFLAESYKMSGKERKKHDTFFDDFYNALNQLSGGACHGCRSDPSAKSGCIKGCVVPDCVKERGVDFCAECEDFPCQKGRDFFAGNAAAAWENGSRRIREIGIAAYFDEKKDVSHYVSYKKKNAKG